MARDSERARGEGMRLRYHAETSCEPVKYQMPNRAIRNSGSAKIPGETAFESREFVEGVVATFGLERADAFQDRRLRFIASSRDQQEIGGAVVHPSLFSIMFGGAFPRGDSLQKRQANIFNIRTKCGHSLRIRFCVEQRAPRVGGFTRPSGDVPVGERAQRVSESL